MSGNTEEIPVATHETPISSLIFVVCVIGSTLICATSMLDLARGNFRGAAASFAAATIICIVATLYRSEASQHEETRRTLAESREALTHMNALNDARHVEAPRG